MKTVAPSAVYSANYVLDLKRTLVCWQLAFIISQLHLLMLR